MHEHRRLVVRDCRASMLSFARYVRASRIRPRVERHSTGDCCRACVATYVAASRRSVEAKAATGRIEDTNGMPVFEWVLTRGIEEIA
jgi:hypothetical protein